MQIYETSLLFDIEDQELGIGAADVLDLEFRSPGSAHEAAITLTKLQTTVDFHTAAFGDSSVVTRGLDHVDECFPTSGRVRERVLDDLSRSKDTGLHGKETLERRRARAFPFLKNVVLTDGGHDFQKLVGLLGIGEVASEVFGCKTGGVRLNPDLKEVNLLLFVPVVFAVADASSSAGKLNVTTLQDLEVAHGIFVLQLAGDNVGEDLHFTVSVCAKAFAWVNPILIDDTERSERLEFRVPVVRERESVESLQPSVVGMSSFVTRTRDEFDLGVFGRQILSCGGGHGTNGDRRRFGDTRGQATEQWRIQRG